MTSYSQMVAEFKQHLQTLEEKVKERTSIKMEDFYPDVVKYNLMAHKIIMGWKIIRVWEHFAWQKGLNYDVLEYISNVGEDGDDGKEQRCDCYVSDTPKWEDYFMIFPLDQYEYCESICAILEARWKDSRFMIVPHLARKF